MSESFIKLREWKASVDNFIFKNSSCQFVEETRFLRGALGYLIIFVDCLYVKTTDVVMMLFATLL